ncbi:hypothetical protein DFS34DRAFT_183106 [Phlyctochytrium arcticum]|nr:hypothetical protein DFS34DRAFT_183106 [Phlyctochytrium arcticum]
MVAAKRVPTMSSARQTLSKPTTSIRITFLKLLIFIWCNGLSSVEAQPWTSTYVAADIGQDSPNCGVAVNTPCKTLQAGINVTASGGNVIVGPGLYTGLGNVLLKFDDRKIRLTSTHGAERTIIDANNLSRIIWFNGGETNATYIAGFTFQGGKSSSGGCLGFTGNAAPIIEDSIFTNCETSDQLSPSFGQEQIGAGGALYIGGSSSPTFRRCVFSSNSASLGGGSVWLTDNSNPLFDSCSFVNETARMYGGSIVSEQQGAGRFQNCTFEYNKSQYGGTFDSGGTSSTSFVNCTLANNVADLGGACYTYTNSAPIFQDCVFVNNKASGNGGAVLVTSKSHPNFTSATFSQNIAGGTGGAFHVEILGKVTLVNSTFSENVATTGGGAISGRLNAEISLDTCSFQGNHAGAHSGAIEVADSVMVMDRNSVFANNYCDTDAGAIMVRVNATYDAKGSTFLNNNATSNGGAIHISDSGKAKLENVRLVGNRAKRNGGALSITSSGQVVLLNSELSGNTAEDKGGGMYVGTLPFPNDSNDRYVQINDTIVRGNKASQGGGIAVASAIPIALRGSHIRANKAHFGGGIWLASDNNAMDGMSYITDNIAERLDVEGLPTGAVLVQPDRLPANITVPEGFTGGAGNETLVNESILRGGGGGGVYHEGPLSSLICDPFCNFLNNTASYGENQGGSPHRLVPNTELLLVSPKDTFTITVALYDMLNNTVTDTAEQTVLTLFPLTRNDSPGLEIIGQGLRKLVVKNGIVQFGPLSVIGFLNRSYTLGIWSDNLPWVSIKVKIVSCGAGWQNSVDPFRTPYRCHMCLNSFSKVPDTDCLPCPAGASCQGPNVTAEPGFWVDPTAPVDIVPTVWRCPPGHCIGDSKCAEHRQGVLCAECNEGFSDWRGSGICELCDQDAPQWLMIPIFAGFIVSGILIRFPSLCKSSISATLVFFVQYSSVLLPASPGFEVITQSVNLAFGWINKFSGTSCILRMNNFERIIFGGFFPLAGLLSCLAWGVLLKIFYTFVGYRTKRNRNRADVASMSNSVIFEESVNVPEKIVIAWINAFLFIVLWAYLLLSRVVLRLLSCTQIAGRYVVSEAPDQLCQQGAHAKWWIIGWTLVVLWVIGLPVSLVGFLKWALLARARGGSQFWVLSLEQIYADFKPRFWFFEFVFLVRKLGVVLLDVFTLFDPVAKSFAGLLFAFGNLCCLTFLIRPWRRTRDNRMEEFLLLILLFEAGLSLGESSASTASSGANATRPTKMIRTMQMGGLCFGVAVACLMAIPRLRKFCSRWRFKVLGALDEPRLKRRGKRLKLDNSANTIRASATLDRAEMGRAPGVEDGTNHGKGPVISITEEGSLSSSSDDDSPVPQHSPITRTIFSPSSSTIPHSHADLDVEQGKIVPAHSLIPPQSGSRRGSKSATNSVMSVIHATERWAEEKSMSTGLLSSAHLAAASAHLRRSSVSAHSDIDKDGQPRI